MTLRQVFGDGGATEQTLAAILVELGQKLEAGGQVALDAPTLAALEQISADLRVAGQPVSETNPIPVMTQDSSSQEYTHVVSTLTASGSSTVHTPASGKAIRLHWIYAVNDPSATSTPMLDIALGSEVIYRAWAISKKQTITGAVNAPLTIALSTAGTVAVTAILEEV